MAPFDSDHDVTSVVNVVVPAAAIPPERTRHGPPVDVEAPRPPEPAPRALDIPAGWDEAATSDSTTAAPRAGPARASGPDDFQPLRTSRRPLVAGVVVLLLVAVAGGGFVVLGGSNRSSPTASRKASQADSALSASLARIDERMMAGAYTGPGGDSALDHLRAAVQAAPGDARVKERQQRLAALFEQRAGEALARDDQAEAAVQFTALLLADPSRSGVKEKLAAAEAQVKNQAKAP